MSKHSMQLRVSVWLENPQGELLFGDGRLQILRAVAERGSLSAAAESLGMSYRGLWARLRHSERRLGFALIESHAGRGPSSGTTLTAEGKALMERYVRLQEETLQAARGAFGRVFTE